MITNLVDYIFPLEQYSRNAKRHYLKIACAALHLAHSWITNGMIQDEKGFCNGYLLQTLTWNGHMKKSP